MDEKIEKLLAVADQISRGEIPEYQHCELFTAGAYDLLLVNAYGADAFDLLSEICSMFDSISSNPERLKGYYFLISELAIKSKTTEMPHGMKEIIDKNHDLSIDLRKWYRLNG